MSEGKKESAKKSSTKKVVSEKPKAAKKPAAKRDSSKTKKIKLEEKATEELLEEKKEPGAAGPEESRERKVEEKPKPGMKEEAEAVEEKELSDEEMRKFIEEQLEKITVQDMVGQMMISLASVGYQKLGLPESVNLKYRDFAQASLAIDSLQALIRAAEGRMEESKLAPFRGTLANLQMNFVKLKGTTRQ